ncbi:hypothetical protein [uncultured Halopseudomonas sp.]|uniref:hypothetical protein n=1 Tax=uncultured Halopseudomonas sp. TaxID=2901193 RepID=UPI0030ECABFD|tara:strand:+ start:9338 stop:10318 length:981 start_codon:yes stop_codon:yes gene_type:complete
MGRTKTEGVAPVDLPELDGQKVSDIQNAAAAAGKLLAQDTMRVSALINQRVGRRQITNMIVKLLTVTDLIDLQAIKESKGYKGFEAFVDEKPVTVTTWDDYCRLVEGKSRESIDNALANFAAFGEELYEAMHQVGIGPSKMRALRKLPDDHRNALIEAAKAGNTDDVEFLAEELIAKHQKEKDELTKERDEAHADYDAQSEVLAKRALELDETRQQLARAQKRIQSLPSNEAMKELRMEVSAAAYEAEALIMGKLRGAFELLNTESATSGEDSRDYMASLVKQLEIQILAIREDYDLPDDSSSEHDWMKPGAAEQAAVSLGIESDH